VDVLAASAVPLPPAETKVAVRTPDAATTTRPWRSVRSVCAIALLGVVRLARSTPRGPLVSGRLRRRLATRRYGWHDTADGSEVTA
jgi:hypothetical protein